MIYFSLPNFYLNHKIINNFINLPKEYFKFPVAFSAAAGNLPYCYWNGGYNNNEGLGLIYEEIIACISSMRIPIRFNCSNIFLEKEDYENVFANLILQIGENGANTISISDISLYNFLKEKFPNYNYIFSKEANLKFPFSEEILNTILTENIFKLIEIPEEKVLDLNFLKNIKDLSKIELPINSCCNLQCYNYKQCKYISHELQYNYSIKNNYINCLQPLTKEDNILISSEDLLNIYVPLGINHFSINFSPKINILDFLIDYFIKDEFKYKSLELMKEI